MALTRKKLKAMGLEVEQIDQIIDEHLETVDALKEERDEYKEKASKVTSLENQLKDYQSKGDFEKKYNDEHEAFENYKKAQSLKETRQAKATAYESLLKEAGVLEKTIPLILKATSFDEIELDEKGNIKSKEELANSIKTDYADFIKKTKGADIDNPPSNPTGGAGFKDMTLDKKMIFANEHPNDPEVRSWLEGKGE